MNLEYSFSSSLIVSCDGQALSAMINAMLVLFLPVPARLLFEARNQKKEAKEMAVIQAMKRREEDKANERAQAVL